MRSPAAAGAVPLPPPPARPYVGNAGALCQGGGRHRAVVVVVIVVAAAGPLGRAWAIQAAGGLRWTAKSAGPRRSLARLEVGAQAGEWKEE